MAIRLAPVQRYPIGLLPGGMVTVARDLEVARGPDRQSRSLVGGLGVHTGSIANRRRHQGEPGDQTYPTHPTHQTYSTH